MQYTAEASTTLPLRSGLVPFVTRFANPSGGNVLSPPSRGHRGSSRTAFCCARCRRVRHSKKSMPRQSASSSADAAKPVPGGSVVYAQEAEVNSMCLQEAQLDISGINYARTIYDTLTAPDENGKFVPFLAAKVEHNADATVWTITLRDGVVFHDGTPLTATVVKNNLDAYRGAYEGRSPVLFSLVFKPFIKDITATTRRRPGRDDDGPWQAFDSTCGRAPVGIIAQAQLDAGADCAKKLIGTGPFKLKDWVVGDHFTAVKNENYWQKDKDGVQLPYLNEITFKPVPDGQQRLNGLQSGQFQLIHTSSSIDQEQMRALAQQGTITNLESDKFARPAPDGCASPSTRPTTRLPGSPSATSTPAGGGTGARPRHVDRGRGKNIPRWPVVRFAPAAGFLEDSGWPAFTSKRPRRRWRPTRRNTARTWSSPTRHADPEGVERRTSSGHVRGSRHEGVDVHRRAGAVHQHRRRPELQMYGWRNFRAAPRLLFVWWHCGNAAAAPCDNLVNFGGFNDPRSAPTSRGSRRNGSREAQGAVRGREPPFASSCTTLWRTGRCGPWARAEGARRHRPDLRRQQAEPGLRHRKPNERPVRHAVTSAPHESAAR